MDRNERTFFVVALAWQRQKQVERSRPALKLLEFARSLGLNRRDYNRINSAVDLHIQHQDAAVRFKRRGWVT
jgi:hypothetical protein